MQQRIKEKENNINCFHEVELEFRGRLRYIAAK